MTTYINKEDRKLSSDYESVAGTDQVKVSQISFTRLNYI